MGQTPKVDFEGYGDALLYFGLAAAMILVTIFAYWFPKNRLGRDENVPVIERAPQGQGNRRQAAGRRNRGRIGEFCLYSIRSSKVVYVVYLLVIRTADDDSDSDGGRGGRRGGGRAAPIPESDGSEHEAELDERLNDPKLGAKKRAKLEAKAEKKAQREVREKVYYYAI